MINKAGVRQFTRLTDTPNSYTGNAKKPLVVNVGETALEYPTTDVDFDNQKIVNVDNPTNPQDVATKYYTDLIAAGLSLRLSCRLATTGNLVATYAGGVLTETGFGALSVDGTTPDVGDRILVKDQTTGQDNGIYTVTVVGDGGTSYVLTRATDMDTSGETIAGMFTFITEGTANALLGFALVTPDPITLDTTPLEFSQLSAATNYIAGAGLNLAGLTFSVDFTAVQALDATLTALAGMNGTAGFVVQTAADTFTKRTLTEVVDGGIQIVNGDGVAADPAIGLDILALTTQDPNTQLDYLVFHDTANANYKKVIVRDVAYKGSWFRQVGTTPNQIWHHNAITSSNTSTLAVTVGAADSTMYAIPFPPNAIIGGTLDRIGINVNVAVANTVCRLGIYSSSGPGELYPSQLILDAGEVSTATVGTKTITINQGLTPGTLYWLVMHFDSTVNVAGGPTIRAWGAAAMPNTLGTSSAFGTTANTYISALLQAYGVLPDPFPAGGAPRTGNAPAFIYRYSA